MAKKRWVDTKFWDDNYIVELSASEKLTFIYLLTNQLTTLCGAYEISKRRIAFDTGQTVDTVSQAVDRLVSDSRIEYVGGWVVIHNYAKYQGDNPSIREGIEREKTALPSQIRQSVDRLGTGTPPLLLPKPKPKPKHLEDEYADKPPTQRFTPPTLEMVFNQCQNQAEAEKFFDWFSSNGWRVGKNPMKDWKAALRNWMRRGKEFNITNRPHVEKQSTGQHWEVIS
jgi:hypothetical protein